MDSVALLVVVAVLVIGVAVGLWRRRTDGRLRAVGSRTATGRIFGGRIFGSRSVSSWSVSERSGGGRPGDGRAGDGRSSGGAGEAEAVDEERLDAGLLTALGVAPAGATLLQFSSAFCAPCRALRRVSSEVAGMIPGVQHIEVDAESHLDEVRALNIWRTPTLLVLDADGRVSKRATGVPSKPQLIAALGEVLPAAR
jgi:thiol-disulfide isomerase/thioredoxin